MSSRGRITMVTIRGAGSGGFRLITNLGCAGYRIWLQTSLHLTHHIQDATVRSYSIPCR